MLHFLYMLDGMHCFMDGVHMFGAFVFGHVACVSCPGCSSDPGVYAKLLQIICAVLGVHSSCVAPVTRQLAAYAVALVSRP